jgi:hypothetical protein
MVKKSGSRTEERHEHDGVGDDAFEDRQRQFTTALRLAILLCAS